MAWLREIFRSSLGKKYLMAVTGLLLGAFLLLHAAGTSLLVRGPATFLAYHQRLQAQGLLLAVAELGLFSLLFLHSAVGLTLLWHNRRARGIAYQGKKSRSPRSWSGVTMPYTGLVLLAFLGLHLADFHGRAPEESLAGLVVATLRAPAHGLLYLGALIALALHLGHGFWSLFQSLGVSHPRYDCLIRWLSNLTATLIVTIFGFLILLLHSPLP